MTALVPNRFLFSLEYPLSYREIPPAIDGDVSDWSDLERLPNFGQLDEEEDFADVWTCWNESGLFVACRVTEKRAALRCDPASYWTGDNLRLCIDTRDARANKRATRYCRQFFFLPTGGGPAKNNPVAGVGQFQRAREEPQPIPVDQIKIASVVSRVGYSLEAYVPVSCLFGFDPVEHSRIGFYYILEDTDHGRQFLTIGDDLLWYADPSTWATAVLVR